MGYRVIVLDYTTRIPNFRLVARLLRLLREEKPGVVHTTGAEANFHGILAAYLANVPVRVAEEIGMPAHGRKAKQIFKWVYSRASGVIAVAHLVERFLLETGEVPREKLSVIYNPVDIRSFSGVSKELHHDVFRILAVCRLDPIKNLDLLINAFAVVSKDRKELPMELWIIGDGPERGRLEELADALDLGSGVTFWGYQASPAGFYKSVSLFVLPSFSEGLPVSLAEAMLTGTPCVATKIGGAPEFVQDGVNGWLIDPYDAGAFTQRLREILDLSPEQKSLIAEKGRDTAGRLFTPDQYMSRLYKLYHDLQGGTS
jgi:glycosyltransferase involved in cell wall biosynthesis